MTDELAAPSPGPAHGRQAAPATPPAAALPIAQMREILSGLRTAEAEAPRTHALHWLVFQRYQHHPLMWQFTWQEAWAVHAQTALIGLLRMVIDENRATPDILMGVAGAMANLFGALEAAHRTWNRFLQVMPAAAQDPTIKSFMERMRMEVELLHRLNKPAVQVHRAIMQSLPAPIADMNA